MIERIKSNEEKLDKLIGMLNRLEEALEEFENDQNTIKELNEYYGSKEWFEDKEAFETGEIKNVKAGVLSEDAVWNINERLHELIKRVNEIFSK